jgi:putative Holliday junction resolvase
MRYLGIDFGTKKVGLALSDEAGTMGFPHSLLPNDGRLLDAVAALAANESVGAVVMGESRAYGGNENPVAKEARAFGEALAARTGLPLAYEPEMLTTQEARRMPDGSRMKGEPAVDASAAALILTSYLTRNAGSRP